MTPASLNTVVAASEFEAGIRYSRSSRHKISDKINTPKKFGAKEIYKALKENAGEKADISNRRIPTAEDIQEMINWGTTYKKQSPNCSKRQLRNAIKKHFQIEEL